jgi:hypothetical protein
MKNILFVAISFTASSCCHCGDFSASSFVNAFILPAGDVGSHFRQLKRHTLPRSSLARALPVTYSFYPKLRTDEATNDSNANIYFEKSQDGDGDSKVSLLRLLAKVPPNQSTSYELTQAILRAVSGLEKQCPTPEADVLTRLAGK